MDSQVDEFEYRRTMVTSLIWSPNGEYLGVAAEHYSEGNEPSFYRVLVFNAADLRLMASLPHDGGAQLAWSLDSAFLYVASRAGSIEKYTTSTWQLAASLPPQTNYHIVELQNFKISRDGHWLIVAIHRLDGSGSYLIDANSLEVVQSSHLGGFDWMDFSLSGNLLIGVGMNYARKGCIWFRDTKTLATIEKMEVDVDQKGLCGGSLSPDGKWLALGGWDWHITIMELATRKVVNRFKGDTIIGYLDWHPDGVQLAAHGKHIWNAFTGTPTQKLEGIGEPFAFRHDGRLASSMMYFGYLPLDETLPMNELIRFAEVPALG